MIINYAEKITLKLWFTLRKKSHVNVCFSDTITHDLTMQAKLHLTVDFSQTKLQFSINCKVNALYWTSQTKFKWHVKSRDKNDNSFISLLCHCGNHNATHISGPSTFIHKISWLSQTHDFSWLSQIYDLNKLGTWWLQWHRQCNKWTEITNTNSQRNAWDNSKLIYIESTW